MFIDKIQFKKVVKWYIIAAVLLLAAAAAIIGFTFRSEISFAYHTERFLEDFSHGRIAVTDDVLQEKAEKYPCIINAVKIKSDNTVLAKANTHLLPEGALQFDHIKKHTWKIEGVSGVTISQLGKGTVGRWLYGVADNGILDKILEESQLDQSYQSKNRLNSLDNSKRYDYIIASNDNGERLLLFFDWKPVKNGAAALLLGAIVIILIIMSAWLLMAIWVYKDATKRQCAGVVWGLLALFTSVWGVAAYLLHRGYHKSCPSCFVLQGKDYIYCVACGIKIANTCKKCNSILGAKDGYCAYCGKMVEEIKK